MNAAGKACVSKALAFAKKATLGNLAKMRYARLIARAMECA